MMTSLYFWYWSWPLTNRYHNSGTLNGTFSHRHKSTLMILTETTLENKVHGQNCVSGDIVIYFFYVMLKSNTYKCICIAYMVFGHASSEDDEPSAVGCHRHGVNPCYIWNPVLVKNGCDNNKQNLAGTPGNIFYPQWCPISSRGSHMRNNTTCLQWHHLSAQDWKWGCCSETHTGLYSVTAQCLIVLSATCIHHTSRKVEKPVLSGFIYESAGLGLGSRVKGSG